VEVFAGSHRKKRRGKLCAKFYLSLKTGISEGGRERMVKILAEEAGTIFPDDFCAEFKLFNRHGYGVQNLQKVSNSFCYQLKK